MSIVDEDDYAKTIRNRKKLRTNELDMVAYAAETKETDENERVYEFQVSRALNRIDNMLNDFPFQYTDNGVNRPTLFAAGKIKQLRNGPGLEFDLGRLSSKFHSFKRILDEVLDIEREILDKKRRVESSESEMKDRLKKYAYFKEIGRDFDLEKVTEAEVDRRLALSTILQGVERNVLSWKNALLTSIVDGDGESVKFYKREVDRLLVEATRYDVFMSLKEKTNSSALHNEWSKNNR